MSNTRIQLALDNWDAYVSQLSGMPDRELQNKLELIHLQSEIAERTKNSESLELLDIWRRQVIEARIHKAENNIPDAPNEIELAIRDIETTVAQSEEREEKFKETAPEPAAKPKIKEEDKDQLSLF